MDNSVIHSIWIICCVILVFVQQIGFLCLESGLVRSKNRINVAAKNLTDLTLVLIVYALIGHGVLTGQWFNLTQMPLDTHPYNTLPSLLLYALYCATTITIVSGAVAERMLIKPYLVLGLIVAIVVFPLSASWVWDESGWIAQLGAIDFAGGTVVHVSAGALALAAIMVIGPRSGVFEKNRQSNASDLGLSVLGCLFLWIGWLGFNAGNYLTWHSNTPLVLWNTLSAGAIGGAGYILCVSLVNRLINIGHLINSILAALVGVTAGAHILDTSGTVLFACMGVWSYFLVHNILLKFKLDDAVGAIPVHLGAGASGTLLLPLISNDASFYSQLVLVLAIGSASFLVCWLTLKLMEILGIKIRVSQDQEVQGLNIIEHNARSDLYELVNLMSYHKNTGDLSKRANYDLYTEEGLIANQYYSTLDTINQTQTDLHLAQEKAESASKVKSQFLANMNHELRTPMNGVLGLAQVLRNNVIDSEQLSIINKIMDRGEDMLSLINNLLDFADVQDEKIQLEPIKTDIESILSSLKIKYEDIAKTKGLNFELCGDNIDFDWALVDKRRLTQILDHLLHNAMKFTQQGSVTLSHKSILKHPEHAKLEFSVKDTGIGIPQDAQGDIFSAFEQVDTSSNRMFEGAGIGLSICQELLHKMDSELKLESTPNKGSLFYFSITCDVGKNISEFDQAIKDEVFTEKNILIVEDNHINYVVLESILEELKTKNYHAENGKIAVDMFMEREYDYMLMDCMLPIMDGPTATQKIREYEVKHDLAMTPIIALTADTTEENQSRCAKAGTNGFIGKPYTYEALISQLLKLKKL